MAIGDVLGLMGLGKNKSDSEAISELSALPIVAVSENKTLALTDGGKVQLVSAAATITIPPNSSVAFPIGRQITILSATTDTVTISAGDGVTLRYRTGTKIDGQNAGATLIKTATDTWYLIGALKA